MSSRVNSRGSNIPASATTSAEGKRIVRRGVVVNESGHVDETIPVRPRHESPPRLPSQPAGPLLDSVDLSSRTVLAVTAGYVTLAPLKRPRRVDDLLPRRSPRGVKMRRVISSTRMHVIPLTSLNELRVWHKVQTSYYVGDTRHVFRNLQSSASVGGAKGNRTTFLKKRGLFCHRSTRERANKREREKRDKNGILCDYKTQMEGKTFISSDDHPANSITK